MKGKRYSVEQITAAVKQHEMGTKVPDICRKLGIAEVPFIVGREAMAVWSRAKSESLNCSEKKMND